MKKIASLFLLFYVCLQASAQTGMITGKITDTSAKKILSLATVTVFKARDTSIVTYRLSNDEGEFRVPGLPFETPLRVMVTYSGYMAFRKDFVLSAAHPTIHIDSVRMIPTSSQLDEVTVFAERPPVTIKNDTIEFNASSFKTLPNALVEDLLKKLPGVMVDADGNITVNGKVVNRILVDGKTFFGDDPKMASRNLPANIIDKVQVTDDKEEMLRNGDDNLNNVGKVVNITLKKGVKKGWFGKVYAGLGTNNNYETGGIANIFRDTLQVSVLGYANTLNKPGFSYSDLTQTGGLQRNSSVTGSSSISIWNNGAGTGLSINGVSFGGLTNYGGIATSKGAGINLNHAPNLKESIFAQYFYGNVLVDRQNSNDTKQFNGDTVIGNSSLLTGPVITNAHNIGIGARLKPDSLTNIQVNATYTIGLADESRFSTIISNNNFLGTLSTANIAQDNKTNTYYYRQSLTLTRLSRTKKGRRFAFSHTLDINNKFNNYITDSRTHIFLPTAYDSILQQLRNEGVPQTTASVGFNYSEPLTKVITLRIGSRYEYSKLNDGVGTFNPSSPQKYDVLNGGLSSHFSREGNRFYVNTGMEFKWKNLTITPSARALFQDVNNLSGNLSAAIHQHQNDLLPGLGIVYKQLNFNYSEDVTLPSYVYLMPVADNSNPYLIVHGNPNLLPAQRQNFSINYYFNDPKKNLNISLNSNASFTNNDVIQSTTVDSHGIQTNLPVNADGSANFGFNYNINRQYRNKQNIIFQWNLGAYYGLNKNRLSYNQQSSWQSTFNLNQWAGVNLNFNDKLEWNNSYSLGYNFTAYTNPVFQKLEVSSHNWSSELIVRAPKHVIWETSLNYTYSGVTQPGLPKDFYRWNAAINFTMLKDERGVLRLSINDILDQNASVRISATNNVLTTSQTNTLGRYFMATFTYNIQTMGVHKKVGGEKMFLF